MSALHTDELKIAAALSDAEPLQEELKDFQRKVSDAGRATYNARTGAHDDLVLADKALAARPPQLAGLVQFKAKALDVAYWWILLKKSFWGDDRNFLEPLMRSTRGDVRDHIDSSKIDRGPS